MIQSFYDQSFYADVLNLVTRLFAAMTGLCVEFSFKELYENNLSDCQSDLKDDESNIRQTNRKKKDDTI